MSDRNIRVIAKYDTMTLADWTTHIRPEHGEVLSFHLKGTYIGMWTVCVWGRIVSADAPELYVVYVHPADEVAVAYSKPKIEGGDKSGEGEGGK